MSLIINISLTGCRRRGRVINVKIEIIGINNKMCYYGGRKIILDQNAGTGV